MLWRQVPRSVSSPHSKSTRIFPDLYKLCVHQIFLQNRLDYRIKYLHCSLLPLGMFVEGDLLKQAARALSEEGSRLRGKAAQISHRERQEWVLCRGRLLQRGSDRQGSGGIWKDTVITPPRNIIWTWKGEGRVVSCRQVRFFLDSNFDQMGSAQQTQSSACLR